MNNVCFFLIVAVILYLFSLLWAIIVNFLGGPNFSQYEYLSQKPQICYLLSLSNLFIHFLVHCHKSELIPSNF